MKTVLIIEPDIHFRTTLSTLIEEQGHLVYACSDESETDKFTSHSTVDIVLHGSMLKTDFTPNLLQQQLH